MTTVERITIPSRIEFSPEMGIHLFATGTDGEEYNCRFAIPEDIEALPDCVANAIRMFRASVNRPDFVPWTPSAA